MNVLLTLTKYRPLYFTIISCWFFFSCNGKINEGPISIEFDKHKNFYKEWIVQSNQESEDTLYSLLIPFDSINYPIVKYDSSHKLFASLEYISSQSHGLIMNKLKLSFQRNAETDKSIYQTHNKQDSLSFNSSSTQVIKGSNALTGEYLLYYTNERSIVMNDLSEPKRIETLLSFFKESTAKKVTFYCLQSDKDSTKLKFRY
jgi:hypothetical protein